jgi:hypothetical protein
VVSFRFIAMALFVLWRVLSFDTCNGRVKELHGTEAVGK